MERYLLIQPLEALQHLCVKTRVRLWGRGTWSVRLELQMLRSGALCRVPAEKWRALGCNSIVFMTT